jgi:hypothetical protein
MAGADDRACGLIGFGSVNQDHMKPRKKIPTFKDEDAAREFWASADSTEYIDWSKARRIVLPNFRSTIRPKTTTSPRRAG